MVTNHIEKLYILCVNRYERVKKEYEMKIESIKPAVILLLFVVIFAYCGKESSTTPEARGFLTLTIKQDPIVFTWNTTTEKWETKFTIVFTETGGDQMAVDYINAETEKVIR